VFRIVTPEEFDILNATVPGIHSGGFLRLRNAMGDYRRGAEYLADYHADKSVVPYKAIEFKKSKKTQKVAEWSLDLGYALGGRKRQRKIRFLLDVRI